jgi:hypothetical protein
LASTQAAVGRTGQAEIALGGRLPIVGRGVWRDLAVVGLAGERGVPARYRSHGCESRQVTRRYPRPAGTWLTHRLPLPPGMTSCTYYTVLKTFDASQIHSSFEKTAFSCSICLENRKGKSCIQMPICGCILSVNPPATCDMPLTHSCTPCLSSCWTLAIEEGTLENVSCPSVSCVKTRATSTAKETETDSKLVEEVVGETLRDRWLSLKDKRKAEIGQLIVRHFAAELTSKTLATPSARGRRVKRLCHLPRCRPQPTSLPNLPSLHGRSGSLISQNRLPPHPRSNLHRIWPRLRQTTDGHGTVSARLASTHFAYTARRHGTVPTPLAPFPRRPRWYKNTSLTRKIRHSAGRWRRVGARPTWSASLQSTWKTKRIANGFNRLLALVQVAACAWKRVMGVII